MKIPAGVEDGTALARRARHATVVQSPGDLFVVNQAAPDPRFERRARISGVPRSIETADGALGTSLEVPTPLSRARRALNRAAS